MYQANLQNHIYISLLIISKDKDALDATKPKIEQAQENITLVSTCFAPIPDRLRAINKIWLEASTSNKRAPSTCNSVYKD